MFQLIVDYCEFLSLAVKGQFHACYRRFACIVHYSNPKFGIKTGLGSSTRIGELKHHVRIKDSKRSDTEHLSKIRELEQKIEDIEMGHESEMSEANATIAKLNNDQVGVVEHSKKQRTDT